MVLYNTFKSLKPKFIIPIGIIIILIFNTLLLPNFPGIFNLPKLQSDKFLDLKFSYSTQQAIDTLNQFSVDQIKSYKLILTFIDTIYFVFYGFFYSYIIFQLFKKPKWFWQRFLIFIPIVLSFFDLMENIFILHIINNLPNFDNVSIEIASASTSAKWMLSAIVFGIISYGIIEKTIESSKLK